MREVLIAIKEYDWSKVLHKLEKIEKVGDQLLELDKPFYQEEELAENLGITKRTLANYRNEGKISFVKPEGTKIIIYTREQIHEFLKKYEFKAFK